MGKSSSFAGISWPFDPIPHGFSWFFDGSKRDGFSPGPVHPFALGGWTARKKAARAAARLRVGKTPGRGAENVGQHLGLSENSVPLNPMVNDHYPY